MRLISDYPKFQVGDDWSKTRPLYWGRLTRPVFWTLIERYGLRECLETGIPGRNKAAGTVEWKQPFAGTMSQNRVYVK